MKGEYTVCIKYVYISLGENQRNKDIGQYLHKV